MKRVTIRLYYSESIGIMRRWDRGLRAETGINFILTNLPKLNSLDEVTYAATKS